MATIYSKSGADAATAAAIEALNLGTAATTDADEYATAAQGALADSAVQPGDLGTAAAADAGDFATAAQGAKADASDVDQITLTGDLVLTLPVGRPAGQVYRCAITQDGVGGHTVTYDGQPVTVDLTAGASTTVELVPTGTGWAVAYPPTAPTQPAATLDADVTALAEDPAATLGESMTSRYAPRVAAPRVATLIGGGADETFTLTNCTVTADTTNTLMGQSWKIATDGAKTAIAKVTAFSAGTYTQPLTSAIGVWVYVEDATKITALGVSLYSDATDTNNFQPDLSKLRGGVAANLKTGWNYWRFLKIHCATAGAPTWGTIDHARIYYTSNAATSVSLQAITAEHRAKASIVFIHDGGYAAFDQSPGYHDLRDRGIPVTWSVDCALIGDATHVTRDRLIEIGNENGNSISFHGWNPPAAPSSGFTADGARAETIKCQKWLAALPTRGASGRMFRTAWYQNNCPQSAATDGMVLFNPMSAATHRVGPTSWPPFDRFDYYRHPIHSGTYATYHADLQARHGVLVCYTHNVDATGTGSNASAAEWAEFLSLVDAGMAAGWLECVTFEQLMASSGVTMRRGLTGAWQVEWPEIDGSVTVKRFP